MKEQRYERTQLKSGKLLYFGRIAGWCEETRLHCLLVC